MKIGLKYKNEEHIFDECISAGVPFLKYPILEKEGFPTYDKGTAIDQDKCVRCNICDDVCPRDAIDRDVPLFEGQDKEGLAKGQAVELKIEFVVDDEKCTKCGICGNLCEAINVLHKPFSPETGKVEGEVIWDEAYCDGCNVCAEACPEEAIKVTRTVVGQKKLGNVNIIEEDCCTCQWCVKNCPEEAITVNKIFEGEITFHAEKCPGGCSTCVDVCPANAIYLPTPKPAKDMKGQIEAKIAVNKEVFTDEVLEDLELEKNKLIEKKAIEVGNIFTLGTKFSKPFDLKYKDEKGEEQLVFMGSYGIGISRLMGAIVEVFHDEKGIVWPESVAPFQVHLLSLGEDGQAQKIYDELEKKGIEVLFDDRDVSAGEKFADSDLIGIPLRVVVSKKSLAAGGVEIKKRNESESKVVSIEEFIKQIK